MNQFTPVLRQVISNSRSFALYGILTALLVTPLVWFRGNSELFEVPKMYFVYGASLWSLAWFGVYSAFHGFSFKRTPLDIALLLYLLSALVSTVFSMHPFTSVYGYPSRLHGSLLSTLAYLSLAFVALQLATTEFKRKALVFAGVGIILAALYAVPEHFGGSFSCVIVANTFEANCWVQDVVTRIFGTFGQPNWLAVYMVLGLPILWAMTLTTAKQPLKTVVLTAAASVAMMALIFTKSRSGMLGIAATSVLSVIVLAATYLTSKHIVYRNTLFSVLISVLLPALVFGTVFSPGLWAQGPAAVGDLSTSVGSLLERDEVSLAPISQGGTESGTIRQIVWQGAWQVFLSSPLIGTGVDTFAYSYYQHRPVAHNLVSEWDFLYNRAHNEHLNILATTGILGMIAYLTLWGSIIIIALLKYAKTKSIQSVGLLLIAAGVVGVQLTHFFGFSTVAVTLTSLLLPASLIAEARTFESRIKMRVFPLLLTAVTLVLGLHTGRLYLADLAYARADRYDSKGEYQAASAAYQAALRLHPADARFSADLADSYAKLAVLSSLSNEASAAVQLAIEAGTLSDQTLRNNPWHLNFYKSQAGVFIRLSQLNPTFLEVAQSILIDATRLAPTDPKLVYNIGLLSEDLGKPQEAYEWYQQAINLKPNYAEAYLQAIPLAKSLGKIDEAVAMAETLTTKVSPGQTWALNLQADIQAYQATASSDL